MFATHLECTECGQRLKADLAATICQQCLAPLQVRYDLEAVRAAVSPATIRARSGGMWRWREVLPLPADGDPVTLDEGSTPLLSLPRLGAQLGLNRLELKDESRNPTGSFKDRGMSAAVSMARHLGAKTLAAPSAGNAGGALAAYGARAGLPVVLAMPQDVPASNLLEATLYGASIELLSGTIADCGRWIGERAASEGWTDLSTLKEPYRVEGKKIMGYELVEQCGGSLPDVILYPTGGGTGLVGMDKAFAEMRELGWLGSAATSPRMIAVQAEGCAPIADAFESHSPRAVVPESPRTVASGLRVPSPIGDRWMLRILAETGGLALSVSDDELIAATGDLAREEGIFAAPEAGALVAALRRLIDDGSVRASDHIVLFCTGTGLKYSECFSLSSSS